MATFHLQIVTPDRLAYDGEAEKVILRTVNGDVCIMANHIDYAAALGIGAARVTDAQGNTREAACNGGMLSVSEGVVRVMAITFEWEDEIDLERAQRAQQEAEELVETLRRDNRDYTMAEAKLKRAMTRIGVKE